MKPTTKDDVLAEMQYISKTDKFHAYLEIKCQGSSSMSFAKKNFTVKLYFDEARETKQKKSFKDWNHESNKFVLKANWIDHSHARNIVSARIWDEVVKSRANYNALPVEMRNSPQSGAIDGFPVKLYYNGTYEGLYTWNIGKDAWMWGMDEDNPNHALLSCGYNDNGKLLEKAGNFRALWSGVHEDNWDIEVGTQGTELTNSLNALISCVKDTDDETFKATIGNYLDINSALDYYLYFWANAGLDSLENNMLLATYDGVKWICGAYDMDSVWGLHYTGKNFIAVDFKCPDQYQGSYSLLWERITKLFIPELQARYAELRNGVLSYPNIVTHFERFMDVIGSDLYAEDLTIYTGIPSGSTNNIKQIRNFVRDRLAYVDAEVSAMTLPVACTGITLSASELTFTAEGTQTLTATVTPDGCTDTVVWTTDAASVATVANGVVSAVGNGSATITATCGDYSASCSVSVSGIESGTGGDNENDGWGNDSVTIQLATGMGIDRYGNYVAYTGTCAHEDFVNVSSDYVYTAVISGEHTDFEMYAYDEDENKIEMIIAQTAMDSYTFIVNEFAKYIRCCVYTAGTVETVTITRTVKEMQNMLYNGKVVPQKGSGLLARAKSNAWVIPNYVAVEQNTSYTLDFGASATYPGAHGYDANYAYLGEITGTVSGGTTTFTTPANTAYLRWACAGTPTNPATIVKN